MKETIPNLPDLNPEATAKTVGGDNTVAAPVSPTASPSEPSTTSPSPSVAPAKTENELSLKV